MSFEEALSSLVERCPGVRAAAIVDPDGIAVVTHPRGEEVEATGVELASVLREVEGAGRELQHGRLEQLTVLTDEVVLVLTTIAAGYFLVLVHGRDGLAGKARLVSRLTAARLYPEFV